MMALSKLAAHAASPALDAYDALHPAPGAGQRDASASRDAVKRRAEGELQALLVQEELGWGEGEGGARGAQELAAAVSLVFGGEGWGGGGGGGEGELGGLGGGGGGGVAMIPLSPDQYVN